MLSWQRMENRHVNFCLRMAVFSWLQDFYRLRYHLFILDIKADDNFEVYRKIMNRVESGIILNKRPIIHGFYSSLTKVTNFHYLSLDFVHARNIKANPYILYRKNILLCNVLFWKCVTIMYNAVFDKSEWINVQMNIYAAMFLKRWTLPACCIE